MLSQRLRPVHFSLLLILVLLLTSPHLNPLPGELLHPPLFTARDTHAFRVRRRMYFATPYARVCSAAAREHFLSRFERPARPLLAEVQAPPTLTESRNRVFLSSLPMEVGDGLGHRTCLLNFELYLSKTLNLTYSHRNSTYGSLTRADRNSVERLFGWGRGELPRADVLDRGCAEVGTEPDGCEIASDAVFCRRIRVRRQGGLFDQTVFIPDALAECFLQRAPGLDVAAACAAPVEAFLATFPESNTLFQLTPGRCFHDWLYTNFSTTAHWFGAKYWHSDAARTAERARARTGRGGETDGDGEGDGDGAWEGGRVQMALHVRRGDFFNYTHRVLVGDSTYADMALRVKGAMDDMVGARVPVSIHVFSEGVAVDGRVKDNHDTARMLQSYVDEHGREHADAAGHWERVFQRHKRRRGGGRGGWRADDVVVRVHIATDTVRAVHEMLMADVFIGSVSGLSMQVVRHLGRGVIVLPLHGDEVEEGEEVIPFDYGRNGVDSFVNETLLYERVGKFVRRNRIGCSVW